MSLFRWIRIGGVNLVVNNLVIIFLSGSLLWRSRSGTRRRRVDGGCTWWSPSRGSFPPPSAPPSPWVWTTPRPEPTPRSYVSSTTPSSSSAHPWEVSIFRVSSWYFCTIAYSEQYIWEQSKTQWKWPLRKWRKVKRARKMWLRTKRARRKCWRITTSGRRTDWPTTVTALTSLWCRSTTALRPSRKTCRWRSPTKWCRTLMW